MTKDEALKLALEALEQLQGGCTDHDDGTVEAITVWCPEVIDAIKEALAQPQEPVAWVDLLKKAEDLICSKPLWKQYIDGTPLANDIAVWMADFAQEHTTPPQRPWVGLTDEEMYEAVRPLFRSDWLAQKAVEVSKDEYQAIEAKFKEKNHG